MYCMSVLTDRDQDGHDYAKYISDYCMEKGIVPLIEIYQNQEVFFKQIQRRVPSMVFLSLHLRSLYPRCGIIWCSDLDFSLHAFRLRVEYFFMKPVEHEKIQEGLKAWLERIGKV